MTCIVGILEENGDIYMGGDSAGASGNTLKIRADEKVFINENYIMGFTSSFRMGQLLRYGFMGKEWDVLPPIEVWQESLRVLKSGAFAFIMTTPRQDSLSQVLVDLTKAGFFMGFSSIYWTYASGFPKATNIGLAIDKQECRKQLTKKLGRKPTKEEFEKEWEGFREVISTYSRTSPLTARKIIDNSGKTIDNRNADKFKEYIEKQKEISITIPSSPQAKALNGSYGGFQPKPAVEVIIVAMKPLSEKTYVDQALKNKKGITWLDDCKIPYESEKDKKEGQSSRISKTSGKEFFQYEKPRNGFDRSDRSNLKGRFPANLLVSNDVLNDGIFRQPAGNKGISNRNSGFGCPQEFKPAQYNDGQSFSRYFDLDKWAVAKGVKDTFPFLIVPKASKSEKNKGCEHLDKGEVKHYTKNRRCKKCGYQQVSGSPCKCENPEWEIIERPVMKGGNIHPTVKPIKLTSYLITLGSREGDIILDNFCGSGSTLVSAKELNRRFLGFDTEMEYVEISKARLSAIKYVQEKLL